MDADNDQVMVLLGSRLYVCKTVRLQRYGLQAIPISEADTCYLCVADGYGELIVQDRKIPLSYGKSIRLTAGSQAMISSLPEQYALHVYKMELQRLDLVEHSSTHRMFRATGEVGDAVMELADHFAHHHLQLLMKLEQMYADGDSPLFDREQLLRELLLSWDRGESESEVHANRDNRDRIEMYMKQHYQRRITRDEAAKWVRMNPDYFSMWFKKEMGDGFSSYLNRLRLEKAKELLLTPGRSVQQVAEQTGYGDAFYFSRKFKAWTGESPSVFAARPKRVIALQHMGHLLALGIRPVGAAETYLSRWGVIADQWQDTVMLSEQGHEYEIAPLQPDVIIAHQYLSQEQERRLREIATTVIVPYNQQGPFELLERFAALFGKQAEARQFRERYLQRANQARSRLAGKILPEETVAYYEYRPPYVWLMGESNGRGVYNLYHAFGFRAPAALRTDVLERQKPLRISLEELPRYAADHMLVGVYDASGEQAWDLAQMRNHPVWGQLPAMQRNQLHQVDLRAFSASDTLALYWQLPLQVEYLAD